ncbi:MFS transporter [Amycolatopsis sp. NPDC051061]|uniref:MFS transporter n=1 Tax=Amycolatopsis sp. NPDC051061 TaxID=3155042 RepID=UPI00341382EB
MTADPSSPDPGRSVVPGGGSIRWRVPVLGFLVVFLDGFAGVTLNVVVPTLVREWGVDAAGFTLPLVLTAAGTVAGYLGSGWASARLGRRAVILAGTVVVAAGSAWAATTATLPVLSATRLLTGLGLGLIVPPMTSLAVDHGPLRRREMITAIVSLGLGVGPTVAGSTAGGLIRSFGWESVLWVAAALPVLLLPVLWWGVREPAGSGHRKRGRDTASVRLLFARGRRSVTLLLWAISLLVITSIGVVTTWAPVLLVDYGTSPAGAPAGIAAFGLGGTIGGAILVLVTTRFRAADAIVVTAAIGALFLLVIAQARPGGIGLLALLGGVGLCLIATVNGLTAAAVSRYSAPLQTTAVGWTIALGRFGGIIGPAYGGALAALQFPSSRIVLGTCAIMAVTALLNAVLAVNVRRSRTPA